MSRFIQRNKVAYQGNLSYCRDGRSNHSASLEMGHLAGIDEILVILAQTEKGDDIKALVLDIKIKAFSSYRYDKSAKDFYESGFYGIVNEFLEFLGCIEETKEIENEFLGLLENVEETEEMK